jgi:hypothetical protein
MKNIPVLKASLLAMAILAVPVAQAAAMTKAEYKDGKTRIGAEYKTAKAACDTLAANAKDVCVAEAKGKEKTALADHEFAYTGKAKDKTAALVTLAKANYTVAKEKCDDKAGNDKDVCVKEAKSVETAALANAKRDGKIVDAKVEASDDKRDAEYKVAVEKCDAMSGVAKTSCVASAKSKYGKT